MDKFDYCHFECSEQQLVDISKVFNVRYLN